MMMMIGILDEKWKMNGNARLNALARIKGHVYAQVFSIIFRSIRTKSEDLHSAAAKGKSSGSFLKFDMMYAKRKIEEY